jgi:hydroxysqualene dehydroxylase
MTAAPFGGLTHVVGAGLAGLAAAVALAATRREVRLYEAGGHAGGRCRSYFDAELGCRIDNGNHLLLSGNCRALAYLELIGARDTIEGPGDAGFAFFDATTGHRWTVRPNPGRVPWWILRRGRRVPRTRAQDYLKALALWRADPEATVGEVLDMRCPLSVRLWQPLAVAALNTSAEEASARLFWRVLSETLGRGGAACRPLLPRHGLSETFVDPALVALRRHGAIVHFGLRLRGFEFSGDRVSVLRFESGQVDLAAEDRVILATPAAVAARLVPGLTVPERYSPIVNAHFRCAAPPASPAFLGVIGGTAEWIFRKPEVLSVTVSAARGMVDRPAGELGQSLWRDVATAYQIRSLTVPCVRIVKERRATFLASPDQLSRRPAVVTRWRNLMLAGDYTDTGLPATIEGAIASGFTAAQRALAAGDSGSLPAKLRRPSLPAATGAGIWHEQTPKLQ